MLAFAGEGTHSSVVYTSTLSANPPFFTRLQTLGESTTGVEFAVWGSVYLVVTSARADSSMLRWDGDSFQGPCTETTLPRNSAGGQRIASTGAVGALHIPLPPTGVGNVPQGATARQEEREHLLLIGFGAGARLYRGSRQRIQGLKGPVDIALSPLGDFVYVGKSTQYVSKPCCRRAAQRGQPD